MVRARHAEAADSRWHEAGSPAQKKTVGLNQGTVSGKTGTRGGPVFNLHPNARGCPHQ